MADKSDVAKGAPTGKGNANSAKFSSKAALTGDWMAIPEELPPEHRDPDSLLRSRLIENPLKAAPLDKTFKLRREAERAASNFRRRKPSTIDPAAAGVFNARAFLGESGNWGVAVWYEETV